MATVVNAGSVSAPAAMLSTPMTASRLEHSLAGSG
jgi:hypothetical protein